MIAIIIIITQFSTIIIKINHNIKILLYLVFQTIHWLETKIWVKLNYRVTV